MGDARAAAQDAVAVAEEGRGVLPVGIGLEAGIAQERRGGPLPHLTDALDLVPGRRLLPLGLGRQARAGPAGEGVGLEPGDVDDRRVRIPGADRRRTVADVVLLLPHPRLVRPPGPALVAAALGER